MSVVDHGTAQEVADKLAGRTSWGTPEEKPEGNKEEKKEEVKAEVKPEDKVEDKKEEAKVEETKSEVKEEVKKEEVKEEVKETPKAEETKTEPNEEVDKIRSEFTEKETNYQSKIAELEEAFKNKQPEYANEEIKKLNELAKSGVKLDNSFWEMQSLDLEKFDTSDKSDSLQLRRLELKVANPDYTDKEIDRILQRSYKALFDETLDSDDKEYQEALLDLSIDAKGARTRLSKHKDTIQLPKVDLKAQEEEELRVKEENQKFLTAVKDTMSSYTEQSFTVGDQELKFSINEESNKAVESAIVHNGTFFEDKYLNKETKVIDYETLKSDMLLLSNKDKIHKMIYDQGISLGKSEVVDELENATEDKEDAPVETGKDMNSDWTMEEIRKNRI